MSAEIYIAGTGSFAAEIADVARGAGFEPRALIELQDESRVGSRIHDLEVLPLHLPPHPGAAAVIAAGGDRREAARRLDEAGWDAVAVVHPAAHVSPTTAIGAGAIVLPGAVIGAHTRIGRHVLISRGTLIGHHATVGDCATLGPGANLGGWSVVGEGGHLAMGSVVLNGVRIGSGSLVAAGAVVTVNVEESLRVQGVPARPYQS